MDSAIVLQRERLYLECFGVALQVRYPQATIREVQHISALLREAGTLAPDIIVMVIFDDLAQMQHIEAIIALTPRSKIIIIADQIPEFRVTTVIRQGAHALLSSQAPLDELDVAIDTVAQNRRYIDQKLISYDILAKIVELDAESLTPREYETLTLLAQGLSNKDIALKMIGRDGNAIAVQTVKTYISNILTKLHVSSSKEAIIMAIKKRMIPNQR